MSGTLTPQQLAEWLADGRPLTLLDVREEPEWKIVRLPRAAWRPLSRLPAWIEAFQPLPEDGPVVVYCHHGIRSAQVCGVLRSRGFTAVWNLAGGIDRWSREVDPGAIRY
jgi:rhodanese-related sulfurtransferase